MHEYFNFQNLFVHSWHFNMTEFQKYIQRYLDLIPTENWLEEMKISGEKTLEIYRNISEENSNFAYAEGKWTLKELLQHLNDAERIFAYRALTFF